MSGEIRAARLTEKEIAEWLMRYLLEFGPASTGMQRSRNDWYNYDTNISVYYVVMRPYFDELNDYEVQVNEKGLALIRNYHERNGDR